MLVDGRIRIRTNKLRIRFPEAQKSGVATESGGGGGVLRSLCQAGHDGVKLYLTISYTSQGFQNKFRTGCKEHIRRYINGPAYV